MREPPLLALMLLSTVSACGSEVTEEHLRFTQADACPGEPAEPWFHLLDDDTELPIVHWSSGGRSYLVGKGALPLPRHALPKGDGDAYIAALDPCGSVLWEQRLEVDTDSFVQGAVTDSGSIAFVHTPPDSDATFQGPRTAELGLLRRDGTTAFTKEVRYQPISLSYFNNGLVLDARSDLVALAHACPLEEEDPSCPTGKSALRVVSENGQPQWTGSIGFDAAEAAPPLSALVLGLTVHPSGAVTASAVSWGGPGKLVASGETFDEGPSALVRFDRDGAPKARITNVVAGPITAAGENTWHVRYADVVGPSDGALVFVDEQLTEVAAHPIRYGAGELGALNVHRMWSASEDRLLLTGSVTDGSGSLGIGDLGAKGPFVLMMFPNGTVERLVTTATWNLDRREDGAWIGAGVVGEAPFDYPDQAGRRFIGRTLPW